MAASSLAAQLQVVAATGPQEERLKGKASLLYEIKEAADIDLATIYAVGVQGERESAHPTRSTARLTDGRGRGGPFTRGRRTGRTAVPGVGAFCDPPPPGVEGPAADTLPSIRFS